MWIAGVVVVVMRMRCLIISLIGDLCRRSRRIRLRPGSFDDTVVILSDHFDNQTRRWLSSFRAIDIISISHTATLKSDHMTAIPSRLAADPYTVGHLTCASSHGKVFLWTRA